jgi:hypothetical protein
MSRIKKSSCFGNIIELNGNHNLKNSDSKLNNNDLDTNKILIELLELLENINKKNDKKDENEYNNYFYTTFNELFLLFTFILSYIN